MKKIIISFLLITLLTNCSFDDKTGIWENEEQKKRFDKYLDLPFSIPSSTGFSVNRELAKNDGVEKLVQEDVDYLLKRINDIGYLIEDMGMKKQEELMDKAKNKKDAHL